MIFVVVLEQKKTESFFQSVNRNICLLDSRNLSLVCITVTTLISKFLNSDLAPAKFKIIGKGLCRGPNWQAGKWPVDKGTKTRQICANSCRNRKGCVAFDLSPPADKEDKKAQFIYIRTVSS